VATFDECGNFGARAGVCLDGPSAANWDQPRSHDMCFLPGCVGTGAGLWRFNAALGRNTNGRWRGQCSGDPGDRANGPFGREPLESKGPEYRAEAWSINMIIHGSALSPFTRKVVLSAMEKGIAFERLDLNPYAPPANFESMNPLKRIPIIEDGEFTLADSSAICGYFEAKHADTIALFPKEPMAYGHALWIEEYADTALFTDIGPGVFRPIFINQLLGKPIDHATVESTLSKALPLRLHYLESQLEGHAWFAGDMLTVADLSVYSQMVNLLHAGHLPSSDSYPQLMAHFKRIQTRPSAVKLHRSETAYLGQVLERISSRKA